MTCQACKDKPRGKRCGSCGKLPPVLEVKTEECPVLFHTVEVEGNIKDNPPEVGRFKNTLAVYKEDDYKILYNSDGIPSNLGNGEGISDFNDLRNRPKYAGEAMTGNTNIPDVADAVAGEATIREAADERLEELIGDERTARQEADGGLQTQIDALAAASDVTDIVGTYAELQAYDTSKLNDNDIIKVLQDETHDDETTYYRWIKASDSFSLIGEEGPYYTKAAADAKFQDKLVAGSGITIDPDTNEISADGSETIFYANLNETGTTRHIYKDINFTTAASAQDIIDANNNGQVILRGTSLVNPTAYNDSYLQNAFIMPHNNDYEFVFLDRDLRYEYTASATTDTAFYYDTSEIQSKLTAGSNVQITGTTISATDTTYSNFVGTDGVDAGTAGLVPAPATTDAGKYLKADGTWDSIVIPQSGIPTDATFWGASYDSVNNKVDGVLTVIDNGQTSSFGSSSTVTNTSPTGFYTQNGSVRINTSNSYGNVAFGKGMNVMGQFSWGGNLASSHLEMRCPIRMSSNTSGNNRNKITFLGDPTDQYDATNKSYVDNLVINYSAINGASAPTTATEGKYVGQLYYDTTNEQLYFLKEIDTTTTPATYTWEAIGGGNSGIPTDATFWGRQYDPNTNSIHGALLVHKQDNPREPVYDVRGTGINGDDASRWYGGIEFGESAGEVGFGRRRVNADKTLGVSETYAMFGQNPTAFKMSVPIYMNWSGGESGTFRQIKGLADPTTNHDAANKLYVDNSITSAISGITGVQFEVVATLPATGDAGTIYLVPNAGTAPNIYDEYIYVNNAFEKIGTTEIDLSNYVTDSELQTALLDKADASDIPTKTSDLTNDGADGTSTYVEATDIADVVYKGTQITTTSPNIISTPMIQDGAVTAAKLGNDVNFLSLTMSTTDIGEGAPLAANTLYGVYQ